MSRRLFARTSVATALAGLAVSLAAHADLPRGEGKFLQKAAADNLAEIDLGTMAQSKAMREEVKAFAARMVADHTKALDELKMVASANHVTLPTDPDARHRKTRAKMEKLSGGDFDRAYMKRMVADHRHDVHEFAEHAKSRKESDAKTFAAKTLPTLQTHLEMALATHDVAQGPKRTGERETGSKKP